MVFDEKFLFLNLVVLVEKGVSFGSRLMGFACEQCFFQEIVPKTADTSNYFSP